MSLNADFIYNNDWHDVSNRVVSLRYASGPFGVFNYRAKKLCLERRSLSVAKGDYFSELCPDREDECSIECQISLWDLLELHKMLCDILYKEQMDLETFTSTVYEETISSVRNAIKAMKSNPSLEVWYDGSY